MSSIDDLAESEMSFGSCDHDWSVASAGSAGPGAGINPGTRKQLAGLREKHSQCLQVLRKKSRPSNEAPKVPPQTAGAPEPDMTRQGTSSSVDSELLSRMVTPAPVTEETEESLEARAAQIQEEATMYFARISEVVETQGRTLEQLKDQDLTAELGELCDAVASRAKDLEQLQKQDPQAAVKEVRESLEVCDKMGAQRLQDMRMALDRLRDAVRAHGREIEGIKAQAPQQALQAIQESLEAQGQGFFTAVGPALQAVCEGIVDTQKMACAQAGELDALAQQIHTQQQEHSEELQKLRAALVMQAQCSVMRSEIDKVKRKEAALEPAPNGWEEERQRLQAEVSVPPPVKAELSRQASEAIMQQQLTERGDVLASLRNWQSQAQAAGARVPREAVSLAAAALVGGLVPVMVSSVLRSVWSSSALVPAAMGIKVPLPPSPAREPLGRPGAAATAASASAAEEGRKAPGWRRAALAAAVALGRWPRRPVRRALL